MTAAAADRPWPDGILFRPPTYIEWQADYSARMYLMRTAILAADTGLGKTMMSMGSAGLAVERGSADLVLVCCERNKVEEWLEDLAAHTRMEAVAYDGPRRKRLLDSLPAAVICTYETCRNDIAVFPPKGSRARKLAPGPLMDALRGRRVMVIYDEVTKLGRRTSNLYKAHYWMVGELRKANPDTRVLALSATPMDTDLENIYNEMRIVVPSMPSVKEFEERVIASRDPYGRPRYTPGGREWLRARVEPWILRKRRGDPDVRDSFPPFTENFRRITMHPDQYQAYRALEDLAWDASGSPREVPGLRVLLRQLAGDPWAVLEAARAGSSPLAVMVAEEMGSELEACSSAKAEELAALADSVMAWDGKLMAFTFYGQTVLPALERRLAGRTVFTYHGGLSGAERERRKAAFKAHPGGAVLLSSDAGARGINVREAAVVAEYEAARTPALRTQRRGRADRLGRTEPLTFITFVMESTIERSASIPQLLARMDDMDYMLGDDEAEDYTTAADRREMFAQARPRKAV